MASQARPRFRQNELLVLAVVFSTSVVVSTGIQMGTALFPALSDLFAVPVSRVTLLASVWAFTGLASPLFGPPSDRYGHGTFLMLGLGVFGLGNILCAVAPSFTFLLASQIAIGLGYALAGLSSGAVIGDVFSYETRARAMGLVRVAISVAALAGVPAAAMLAGRATARAPFAAVGGLGLIVLVVSRALHPWRVQAAGQAGHSTSHSRDQSVGGDRHGTVADVLRRPRVVASLLTVMAWAAIPTGVFIYLAAWLQGTFHLDQGRLGMAFSTIGLGALAGNTLTAAWADRLGKRRSTMLGLVVLSGASLALSHAPAVPFALAGLIVFTGALEFAFASYSAFLTELAPASRGTLMSLVSLANGIGTGLVPLAMRPVWEAGGYRYVTLALGALGLGLAITSGFLVREATGPISKRA